MDSGKMHEFKASQSIKGDQIGVLLIRIYLLVHIVNLFNEFDVAFVLILLVWSN